MYYTNEYYILMDDFFVKREVETDSFYLLDKNGYWLDKPELISMFYDSGIPQIMISYAEIKKEINRLKNAAL